MQLIRGHWEITISEQITISDQEITISDQQITISDQ
jgi:hypothetical protein